MVNKEDSPDTSRKKTQPQRSQNSQDDAWNNLEDDEDGRYAQQRSERNTSQILENQHSSESQIPIIQGNVSSSKTRDYQRENQTFSHGNDHSSTKQTSPKSSNEQTSQEFSTEQTSPTSSTEQTSPPSSHEQTSPKHIDNADHADKMANREDPSDSARMNIPSKSSQHSQDDFSSTDSPDSCSSDKSSNQINQHGSSSACQHGDNNTLINNFYQRDQELMEYVQSIERRVQRIEGQLSEDAQRKHYLERQNPPIQGDVWHLKPNDCQKGHHTSPSRDDERSLDQTCTQRSTEQTQPKKIDIEETRAKSIDPSTTVSEPSREIKTPTEALTAAVPQRDIEGSCEKDQTADIRDPSREDFEYRLKEVVLNVCPSEKPSDSSNGSMDSTQTSNSLLNVQQILGKLPCKTTEETGSFKPHPHSLESEGATAAICAQAVGNNPNPFQQTSGVAVCAQVSGITGNPFQKTRKESVPSKEQGVKAAMWWWKDDVNIWHKYENDMIEKLETAYKKNPKGLCLLTKNGRSFCVYFKLMTAELLSDETKHGVQRKVVSKDELALLESFNTFSTKEPNY